MGYETNQYWFALRPVLVTNIDQYCSRFGSLLVASLTSTGSFLLLPVVHTGKPHIPSLDAAGDIGLALLERGESYLLRSFFLRATRAPLGTS